MTACLGPAKMPPDLHFKVSAPTATRTRDLLLRRQSLYPLSYRGPVASLPAGHVRRSRVAGSGQGKRRRERGADTTIRSAKNVF